MGRTALVAPLLLLTVGTFASLLLPILDCPECGEEAVCLRCGERRRLTPLSRWLRPPSHPQIVGLLRGYFDDPVSWLSDAPAFPAPDAFRWGTDPRHFKDPDVLRVGESRVMAVFGWTTTSAAAGSPSRVVLYERTGEEVDRLDLWLDDSPHLLGELRKEEAAVVFHVADVDPRPAKYFVRRSDGSVQAVPLSSWPPDWPATGIGRIVVREGRLELVPP